MTEAALRNELPRLFELKDLQRDPSHPDAYFLDFAQSLKDEPGMYRDFLKLERKLAVLDIDAWKDLKQRAVGLLQNRQNGRGWQALFDVLHSEALGYVYLQSIGSTEIRFVPRAHNRTPDLEGRLNGDAVLCEVKTINISKEEAERRRRIYQGEIVVGDSRAKVEDGFLRKLTSDLKYAVEQLDAQDPQRKARRFIFTVVHFDDWAGHYQPEYVQQIDKHLLANPILGADLVFYLASNFFKRTFIMQSASVFDPESML